MDTISNRAGPGSSCLVRRSYNLSEEASLRGMAERTNALVLKTSGDNTPVGSNPTAPARRKPEDVTSSVDQRKQDHRCAHQRGLGEVEESHRAAAIAAGEVPRYRRANKTEAPKDPGSNRRPTDPTWTLRDLWDPPNVGFGRPSRRLGSRKRTLRGLSGSNATERCSTRVRSSCPYGFGPVNKANGTRHANYRCNECRKHRG